VKANDVNALAEKYFGQWKKGSYVSNVPKEPEQKETRYVHLQVPNFPPYLQLAFKAPAFSDKTMDMTALDILSSILFSEKSDLYKKLVIQEQKVRNLGGGASDSRDPYLFSIESSLVKAEDMQYVKDEIMKAIEKAKKEPVNEAVLKETKSHIKYSFAMRIDSPDAIANSLSNYIWITGDPESLNRTYANYEKITAKDLMMVANKFLTTDHLTIATISPNEEGGIK
jgi:zinc protease